MKLLERFRRKKVEEPKQDELRDNVRYTIAWTRTREQSICPGGVNRYYSFTGFKDEILDVLVFLHQFNDLTSLKIDRSMTSEFASRGTIPQASDGHYHMTNGEVSIHPWKECPDNPDRYKTKDLKHEPV